MPVIILLALLLYLLSQQKGGIPTDIKSTVQPLRRVTGSNTRTGQQFASNLVYHSGVPKNMTNTISVETETAATRAHLMAQGDLGFSEPQRTTNAGIQQSIPGLGGIGIAGSNASGGFSSGAYKFISLKDIG